MNTYLNLQITPDNLPNTGILYVDHQKNRRSGHMSHALAEYKKGHIISFYSNCSYNRNTNSPGHNGFGWIEYRRSADGGKTWDEPQKLPYSWEALLNEPFTISCEKVVSVKENEIVAFCTRNLNPNGWEPHLEPMVVISRDGGETWSAPTVLCDKKGRVFDALVCDGAIYALMNDGVWKIGNPEEGYYLYKSEDCGETFTLVSQVPSAINDAYGNIKIMDDGSMICYLYNQKDEYNLYYHISYDMGKTWEKHGKSYLAKRIRNPQVGKVKGGYILHGRAGCETPELPPHFVLYTSADGINWDEGIYLCEVENQSAYYSNNLVINNDDGSQKVLIQSSVPYDRGRVNVCHWFLDIK